MTPRAFLIHGWAGSPEEAWRPWLRDELEGRGFEIKMPAMPDAAHPEMEAWVKALSQTVGDVDENCFFVGHSLGCIAILRYLETLPKDVKIGGMVLVAGFTSHLGIKDLASFFERPIDWEAIRSHGGRITAIHSDNDFYVSLHYADFFKKELGAKIVIEHGRGHFSGSDGITQLPSALEAIL